MREPNPEDAFHVLKELEQMDSASQRAMARYHGFSLGKMNFTHSKNKSGYKYVLTPSGLKTKYRLAQQFLIQKELEYEKIQQELHEIKQYLNRTEN